MRVLIGTLGIAVLLGLSFEALQRGWADILAFQGRAAIRAWEKDRRTLPDEVWALGYERLQNARELDPAHPGIIEDIGRLYEIRSAGKPPSLPAAREDLGRALTYLRQSARARPGSPYTWANIALVKSRLGQRDAEYLDAIRLGGQFGPWEPEVQITVAEIGMRDWDQLPRPTRSIVSAAIDRGLKRQDAAIFALAMRHGRFELVCASPKAGRSRLALRCI